MGTWDVGPFDNHSARELVGAIVDGTFDYARFRADCRFNNMCADSAEATIALAALVVYDARELPAGVTSKMLEQLYTPESLSWLRAQVRCALDASLSQIYALWEATGELDCWLAMTFDLQERLDVLAAPQHLTCAG